MSHLSEKELKGYIHKTLKPGDLISADRHLDECDQCRGSLTDLVNMDPNLLFIAGNLDDDAAYDDHLSYEQLESYVDGGLSDVSREIADVHTQVCTHCRQQINDLEEIRASLGTVAIRPSAQNPSIWEQIRAAFPLRIAMAAAGLVILGLGLWAVSNLIKAPIEMAVVTEPVMEQPETAVVADTENGNVEELDDPAVNAQTTAVVTLVDGSGRIELDAGGNVTGVPSRFGPKVRNILRTQDIQVSTADRQLSGSSGVLMSGSSAGVPFALTGPVGKIIISDRPQFTWKPLSGAESYVVAVFDESFNKVAESPPIKRPSWTVNERLKRGNTYNWQVTAVKNGEELRSPTRPAPDARFRVIDAAAASEIEAAKQTRSHLLLGSVYASAGMIADAEREFQLLMRQNPRSELARKLLRKVQAQR